MKLNWGNSLLIFFILYVGTLMFILFKSFDTKHELVMDNYYEHDLNYQKRYDQIQNRKSLPQDLQIYFDKENNVVKLDFGDQSNLQDATVKFYNAANTSNDVEKNFPLTNIERVLEVPLSDVNPGKYDIQVTWNDAAKSYYKEQYFYYQ